MLIAGAIAWWRGCWSLGGRVAYTVVTLAVLAFGWQLAYWNLLGFRY